MCSAFTKYQTLLMIFCQEVSVFSDLANQVDRYESNDQTVMSYFLLLFYYLHKNYSIKMNQMINSDFLFLFSFFNQHKWIKCRRSSFCTQHLHSNIKEIGSIYQWKSCCAVYAIVQFFSFSFNGLIIYNRIKVIYIN